MLGGMLTLSHLCARKHTPAHKPVRSFVMPRVHVKVIVLGKTETIYSDIHVLSISRKFPGN